ncbi:hypothetical protein SHKM778_27560 [Streptomyces sp. KM77-8]|uniref:Class F sortase n=1 Tax=Streptomyces haneummycinicus TaxID=3074435 RepID=A0AAT9HFV3_9ACTN
MAIPDDPSVAGWYRYGPVPGSPRGSAVLVGHVDSDTGALGEFAALYDVRPGDRVEVRRAEAAPVVYRVVSRTTVPKDELPPSVFRRTGDPVLTLITCAPRSNPSAEATSPTSSSRRSRCAGDGVASCAVGSCTRTACTRGRLVRADGSYARTARTRGQLVHADSSYTRMTKKPELRRAQ